MDKGKETLLKHFGDRGAFTTSEAKGVLEISRKYLIPFLEHLDTIGFTRRTPDERLLVGGQKK